MHNRNIKTQYYISFHNTNSFFNEEIINLQLQWLDDLIGGCERTQREVEKDGKRVRGERGVADVTQDTLNAERERERERERRKRGVININ